MPEQTSQQPNAYAAGSSGARFFGWLRTLGIVRHNGWIGGVCGGVAARLGIDPIIVRGIAVVIAVLGGPAFLLYAAAWLLLPDAQGEIHLERLIKGHFDPPIIAIIVIALFSFLPFAQGFWWAGAQFWGGLSWLAGFSRAMWGLLVVALIVMFVIWAARSGRVPPTPSPYAPAPSTSPTDAGGGAAHSASASAAPASTTTTAFAAGVAGTATAPPGPGAAPGAGGDDAPAQPQDATPSAPTDAQPTTSQPLPPNDYDDWRARQETWRADYAAWSAQQADAKAIKQQRSAEIRAQAQVLAAEAEEARRRRRAANPRAGAGFVFITLGVALVAAGIASGVALGGSASDYALAIAFAVATGVVGLGIVTAGILRRRSGFLTFVSIVLVVCTLLVALPPREHALIGADAYYTDRAVVHVFQPTGGVTLDYQNPASVSTADVVQGVGTVTVFIADGITARITVDQSDPATRVSATSLDCAKNTSTTVDPQRSTVGDGTKQFIYALGDGAKHVTVRVQQAVGSVEILQTRNGVC